VATSTSIFFTSESHERKKEVSHHFTALKGQIDEAHHRGGAGRLFHLSAAMMPVMSSGGMAMRLTLL